VTQFGNKVASFSKFSFTKSGDSRFNLSDDMKYLVLYLGAVYF